MWLWIKRRDIPPILLLILLIFLILLTLTQILVVHSGLYGRMRNSSKIRKLQKEIQELESNIRSMLNKNVPSMMKFQEMLRFEANSRRFKQIVMEAQGYNKFIERNFNKTKVIARTPCHKVSSNTSCINLTEYQLYKIHLNKLSEKYNSIHNLPYCQAIPRSLKGPLNITLENNDSTEYSIRNSLRSHILVGPGGSWRPRDCLARHRVAIIVPYRDRLLHLLIFLNHLHAFLQRQELNYQVFVVEQTGNNTFNKARLMNAGFIEAMKLNDFDCFIFHDVDLIPEDDRNIYSCPSHPRHLSVAIDEMNYKLAYKELVGGVLNMRTEHFLMVNGYSNLYWGWGAEDDDMAYRIMVVGLRITRPPEKLARYKMIKHVKRTPSDSIKRLKLLYTGPRRYQVDGLNSLSYKRLHLSYRPYYTYLLVDVGEPPTTLW